MNPVSKRAGSTDYSVPVSPGSVRIIDDPLTSEIKIVHAYVPVRSFPSGQVPDDVNPRSHEKLPSRLADTIEDSLKEQPEYFHLLNRGVLILAETVRYDEAAHILHFTLADNEVNGMADGATTDRVLARVKAQIPEFEKLRVEAMPEFMRDAEMHVEIIAGKVGDILVDLAAARNTSIQVKEFALENLGGGFDWLKDALTNSPFAGRIRYRENDPEPVDVRTVLALITMFHPRWTQEKREPIVAYADKGKVLEDFREDVLKPGFFQLRNIVVDVLALYDHIHLTFPAKYEEYKQQIGSRARFGMRKEVRYKEKGVYTLPFTQQKTQYLVPDGWLYPILGAFRMLVKYESPPNPVAWHLDPFRFFDQIGANMVADVVEESEALNNNAAAVGKARPLWNSLRKSVEMRRINIMTGEKEPVVEINLAGPLPTPEGRPESEKPEEPAKPSEASTEEKHKSKPPKKGRE